MTNLFLKKDKKDLHSLAPQNHFPPPRWLLLPFPPLLFVSLNESHQYWTWSEDGICHGKFGHLNITVMMVQRFPFGVESRGWREGMGWGWQIWRRGPKLGECQWFYRTPTHSPPEVEVRGGGCLNFFSSCLKKKDKEVWMQSTLTEPIYS